MHTSLQTLSQTAAEVFVSSTSRDLAPLREWLEHVVVNREALQYHREHFLTPSSRSQEEQSGILNATTIDKIVGAGLNELSHEELRCLSNDAETLSFLYGTIQNRQSCAWLPVMVRDGKLSMEERGIQFDDSLDDTEMNWGEDLDIEDWGDVSFEGDMDPSIPSGKTRSGEVEVPQSVQTWLCAFAQGDDVPFNSEMERWLDRILLDSDAMKAHLGFLDQRGLTPTFSSPSPEVQSVGVLGTQPSENDRVRLLFDPAELKEARNRAVNNLQKLIEEGKTLLGEIDTESEDMS